MYERRGFPCLIDTTTYSEELVGWAPVYNRNSEMPPWLFGGNNPIGQDEALWHPTREAVALSVSVSRRATSVWIWEHKHGVQKLKPIHDSLPDTITYSMIRFVIADHLHSEKSAP